MSDTLDDRALNKLLLLEDSEFYERLSLPISSGLLSENELDSDDDTFNDEIGVLNTQVANGYDLEQLIEIENECLVVTQVR